MKLAPCIFIIFAISIIFFSCDDNSGKSSHPNIFIVKKQADSFMSLEEIRKIDDKGRKGSFLKKITEDAQKDLQIPYLDPTVDFEGRSPVHLKHENVSHDMAEGLSNRFARSSLLYLKTGEDKYKQLVLDQIEALYDTTLWPHWCDKAHMGKEPFVDIRTYRISMWVALAYNWLFDNLSEEERAFIIEGLDRRAIQPFWEKLAQRPGWYKHRHNWFTNMFGGMGITAMALGDAHPQTKMLLDTIVPAMIDFNKTFGPNGEFNEPPGYAGAVRFSVEFAEAYRYYTNNEVNLLNQHPFPEVCYWMLYHTLPPGRQAGFGDTSVEAAPRGSEVVAAVANANNDNILQWFYEQYFEDIKSPMELLWYNAQLQATDPQGILALGKAYEVHGAGIISRTSWDPNSTDCIVYGKAGRETNHDDNDVGQVLIDGFGQRLIIDSGKPNPIYPKDYFRDTIQYEYYSRSSIGHNVLVIDQQEMLSEPNEEARGKIERSWFDNSIGSYWEIDLTPVYPNAKYVSRKVIHLFPGIVLVHDKAKLDGEKNIDLRWHTITFPRTGNGQAFTVVHENAALSAKVIELNQNQLKITTGRHEYKPPYHLTRQGDPLVQDYEPFIKISTRSDDFSLLTLFAVHANNEESPTWIETANGWKININGTEYKVDKEGQGFNVYDGSKPGEGINLE